MEPLEEIYDEDYDQNDSDSLHSRNTSDDDVQSVHRNGMKSIDDFENEMQGELSEIIANGTKVPAAHVGNPGAAGPSTRSCEPDFYDPNLDDKDAAWIEDQRRTEFMARGERPLPISKVVLSCPGCWLVLTRDCQAHDSLPNQYRAMFVMNCVIDYTTVEMVPLRNNLCKRSRSESQQKPESPFHPVRCKRCNTRIAMVDEDEVYHFFDVIAGHS